MKLGVFFTVFSGLELLEQSVRNHRAFCDYVVIGWQAADNHFRHTIRKDFPELAAYLRAEGLIDEAIEFLPDGSRSTKQNETSKHNQGFDALRAAGCTHGMVTATDHFFQHIQAEVVKYNLEKSGDYCAAVQMKTYYREPIYQLDPPEDYYYPMIYRLNDGRRFVTGAKWPVVADPSLKKPLESRELYLVPREVCELHHYSYVRRNIREKLNSANASVNWPNRIDEFATYWEEWDPSLPALMPGAKPKKYDTKIVPNYFDISL